jgi:hypothetical protein
MNERPLFRHDSTDHTFLGVFQGHDLYFSPQGGLPTVIARYGDNGPDYASGMALAEANSILYEARERAIAMGLYAEKKH